MNFSIFTNTAATKKIFSEIRLGKSSSIKIEPADSILKKISEQAYEDFYYFDISSISDADLKKITNKLKKMQELKYGIIDSKSNIVDIAELFHSGMTDYIGKSLLKEGITKKRFTAIEEFVETHFKKPEPKTEPNKEAKPQYKISGPTWKDIKSGEEYTFTMMFIEIDNAKKIKSTYGEHKFNKFTQDFAEYLEENLSDLQGQLWMWMDFGGLILFPFNGKKCNAILPAFKMMIDAPLISFEDFEYEFDFTFRIAIHIGDTVYKKRGNTGTIVSDAINSIFHLGQKFAKPNSMYITEDAFEFIPEQINDLFIDDGIYEKRVQYRLRYLI